MIDLNDSDPVGARKFSSEMACLGGKEITRLIFYESKGLLSQCKRHNVMEPKFSTKSCGCIFKMESTGHWWLNTICEGCFMEVSR